MVTVIGLQYAGIETALWLSHVNEIEKGVFLSGDTSDHLCELFFGKEVKDGPSGDESWIPCVRQQILVEVSTDDDRPMIHYLQ